MAVSVIVTQADVMPHPSTAQPAGRVQIRATANYQCPVPFWSDFFVEVQDVASKEAAIRAALEKVVSAADELKAGAQAALGSLDPS